MGGKQRELLEYASKRRAEIRYEPRSAGRDHDRATGTARELVGQNNQGAKFA
jgi:hypothetical protein